MTAETEGGNLAQIAEIRGRAEDALKYGEPSGFGQLARDVLALLDELSVLRTALKDLTPSPDGGYGTGGQHMRWADAYCDRLREVTEARKALTTLKLEEAK